MGSYNREKEIVNRPCACCGADQDELCLSMRFADYPGRFDYRRCTSCGLIFNSPRLKDLGQLYDSEYFYFWKSPSFMRSRVVQQFSRLIRPVEAELNGQRILEVGSARGHFLSVLKKTGFDAHGIEPGLLQHG